ncbi:MAG: class I SAM-dependent methyltransferase [Rudaea sp.]|nr:class I SAM-dependent methyltransferase [Rudaea sp.]
MNDIERLRATWNALGEDDPLWAILSQPDKRGGRWNPEEFFAAGETEIEGLAGWCEDLQLPCERRRALDFGCGIGRLTRALASRYDEVVGVDISASMLVRARRLQADLHNVRFVENAQSRLDFLADASIDLVYSVITLHHMPAPLQHAYLGEFLRVLAPGGLAVFQIASGYARDWRGLGYRLLPNRFLAPLRRLVHGSRVAAEMHVVAERDIAAIVVAARRRILRAIDVASAGTGFRGRMLFVG